jgi:hypothetical protein
LEASYTTAPIVLDGRLDDPVWKTAKRYPMEIPGDQTSQRKHLEENAHVQLAWDDQNLYVGIRLIDSDIVAEGDRDQTLHFETGDVAEVFLRPVRRTYYWELYATPHGKRSSYLIPGQGRVGLPSNFNYKMKGGVASTLDGTLNNWHDRDEGWSTELKIPIAELERYGDKFASPSAWTLLVARYNYSRYLTEGRGPELSSCPVLPATNFHYLKGYAELRLVK